MEYLSVKDLYRLRIALGKNHHFPEEATWVVAERMGLKRPGRTLDAMSFRMKNRCFECGTVCKRRVKVCARCSPAMFISRKEMLECMKTLRIRGGVAKIKLHLEVAKCSRSSAYLYWRKDFETKVTEWR